MFDKSLPAMPDKLGGNFFGGSGRDVSANAESFACSNEDQAALSNSYLLFHSACSISLNFSAASSARVLPEYKSVWSLNQFVYHSLSLVIDPHCALI